MYVESSASKIRNMSFIDYSANKFRGALLFSQNAETDIVDLYGYGYLSVPRIIVRELHEISYGLHSNKGSVIAYIPIVGNLCATLNVHGTPELIKEGGVLLIPPAADTYVIQPMSACGAEEQRQIRVKKVEFYSTTMPEGLT